MGYANYTPAKVSTNGNGCNSMFDCPQRVDMTFIEEITPVFWDVLQLPPGQLTPQETAVCAVKSSEAIEIIAKLVYNCAVTPKVSVVFGF